MLWQLHPEVPVFLVKEPLVNILVQSLSEIRQSGEVKAAADGESHSGWAGPQQGQPIRNVSLSQKPPRFRPLVVLAQAMAAKARPISAWALSMVAGFSTT